ncbi:MAG TPA: DUF2269 family protein [Acidimicrobiia bacterium]|nr:DUF2269 family protein [Acidimicrobiia bacterium]
MESPLMLALNTESGIYKVLLVCHILVVIVGIGAVFLNGVYAAQIRKHPGPEGRAIAEANEFVTNVAEYFVYSIPVFGILLVLSSGHAWKFSQAWVWMALSLFAIAIGIVHAVMKPGTKKIISLMKEMESSPPPAGGPPPQVAQIQATGNRLAMGGMTLDIFVVLFLLLMIFKPGV